MDSSKLNNWLGITANLAVMIGVVFFIIELDQNTTAIENEASWARTATAVDVYMGIATNSDLVNATSRIQNLTLEEYERALKEIGPDSSGDVRRVQSLWGAIMLQNETKFLTLPMERDKERILLMRVFSSPAMRSFVKTTIGSYNPEFSEYVRDIIGEVQNN